jgi:NAD-dependent SIR2 family protein deacetylase
MMTTTLPWHPNENPEGKTVELHGSLHEWVCRCCQEVTKITTTTTISKKKKPTHCDKC